MKILVVTRDENQPLPKSLEKFKDKRIVWKNKLEKKYFEDIGIVITIGGDGTLLSAAHFIEDQLILGVNKDHQKSEGYLTTTRLSALDKKIDKIIKKKIKIKEYTREKVKIYNGDKYITTELALNETYFGNMNPHHPSNYTIIYRNKRESQRSSGVLVSTGTGSTAWYKAMNGRKFKKTKRQLRFRIRELFIGRLFKAKIRKGKINLQDKLMIISNINHGILAIDSIRTYEIKEGDRIEISMGRPLKVIQ